MKRTTASAPARPPTKSPALPPPSLRKAAPRPWDSHLIHQRQPQLTPPPSSSVIVKLLAFTLGMIVIPISSYFLTVDNVFKGTPLSLSVASVPSSTPSPSLPKPRPRSPNRGAVHPHTVTHVLIHSSKRKHTLTSGRQLNLRGRSRSHHGQRRAGRLHFCRHGRGPVGAAARGERWVRAERWEEGSLNASWLVCWIDGWSFPLLGVGVGIGRAADVRLCFHVQLWELVSSVSSSSV